jgi:uncharacterized protein affecting Mg2+/Co2+ transport
MTQKGLSVGMSFHTRDLAVTSRALYKTLYFYFKFQNNNERKMHIFVYKFTIRNNNNYHQQKIAYLCQT